MTQRTDQYSEQITHELAEIFARDFEFPHHAFVTITRVHTTPDLKNSDIYISVLPAQHTDEVIGVLAKSAKHLKNQLAHSINARTVPNLLFKEDVAEAHANKIEKILSELNEQN